MNVIYIINIISIILAIIGIILVIAKYYNSGTYGNSGNGRNSPDAYGNGRNTPDAYGNGRNGRNKNYFYGGPPGRQRFLKKEEFPLDRGWETFKCSNDEPNCQLNGHRGSTASALLRHIEFDPNK
jgi:hypothetical protein